MPHFGDVRGAYLLIEELHPDRWLARREDSAADQPTVVLELMPSPDTFGTMSKLMWSGDEPLDLDHPNLLPVIELGESGDEHFIASRFVHGVPLESLLNDDEPLPVGAALGLAIDLARALEHLHQQGFFHRLVSTDSIVIDTHGRIRLAHVISFHRWRTMAGDTNRRRPTVHLSCCAPEIMRGQKVSAASDVYSLGMVLLELLGGGTPFDTGDVYDVLKRVAENDLPPVQETLQGLPLGLIDIVERATNFTPRERFETAGELRQALESFAAQASVDLATTVLGSRVPDVPMY